MAIAHIPKVYWIFIGSSAQVVFRENKLHKLTQNGPKGAFFEIFKPILELNSVPMTIAHIPKIYWIFFGSAPQAIFCEKVDLKWPKKVHFRNMCLRQLPIYLKSTEFFLNTQLKRFSWNKPQKLTQNGPKKVHFLKFSNPLFGPNHVSMTIAHVPKVYWIFFGSAAQAFSGNKSYSLTQNGPKRYIFLKNSVHFWYMGQWLIVEPK